MPAIPKSITHSLGVFFFLIPFFPVLFGKLSAQGPQTLRHCSSRQAKVPWAKDFGYSSPGSSGCHFFVTQLWVGHARTGGESTPLDCTLKSLIIGASLNPNIANRPRNRQCSHRYSFRAMWYHYVSLTSFVKWLPFPDLLR